MKKYLILLLVAFSLFVSFGSDSNAIADKNESLLALTATPNPKKLARIERIELDRDEVLIPCPPYFKPLWRELSDSPCFKSHDYLVDVTTFVSNPKYVPLIYQYTVSGGRVTGEGANAVWNLNVRPGTYTITVAIKGERGVSEETRTERITVRECDPCPYINPCPFLSIKGSEKARASESLVFTANVGGGFVKNVTYNWTISQGEIVQGQGTSQIKVKTTSEMTGFIKATVEINGGGVFPDCQKTESATTEITKIKK